MDKISAARTHQAATPARCPGFCQDTCSAFGLSRYRRREKVPMPLRTQRTVCLLAVLLSALLLQLAAADLAATPRNVNTFSSSDNSTAQCESEGLSGECK